MGTPPESPAERLALLESLLADALRFLGHDAREGHTSTLALLELQRVRAEPMAAAQFALRVEANARESLAAIDGFNELARAQVRPLHLAGLDLADLLAEALADAWEAASQRRVRIRAQSHPDQVEGQGDRDLLTRAFAVLLRDAVLASAPGAELVCTLVAEPEGWCVGISLAPPPSAPAVEGGAAMPEPLSVRARALAEVVARRHGGALRIATPGPGRVRWEMYFSPHFFPISASQA